MENIKKFWEILKIENHPVLIVGHLEVTSFRQTLKIKEGDFFILEGKNIKIQEIRKLISWIHLKPLGSPFKLAIILKAENLTLEAANALLKTLEEPPPHSTLVLTTLDEQKIIPTISSRLQKFKLKKPFGLEIPENYLDPQELGKMPFYERFKWVSEIPSEKAKDILVLWQDFFRKKLLQGENDLRILKKISKSSDLLETNISVKLLLENLVIDF